MFHSWSAYHKSFHPKSRGLCQDIPRNLYKRQVRGLFLYPTESYNQDTQSLEPDCKAQHIGHGFMAVPVRKEF